MDDNKEKAYRDYQNGMKYKDIAEKYGVTLNTVKSWKKRYEWTREKGAHKTKRVHTKGPPKGNKNALGHGAPKGNQNATTHGLFAKWLPDETKEILKVVSEQSPSDIIWQNIEIQYTAIIRAQQIMWVNNADDHLKEESGSSLGESGSSESYKIAFAYEQYDSFLKSQSRAMGELRSLIKQFVSIVDETDERRLKLQQMQLNIAKTAKETQFIEERTKLLKGSKKDTSMLKALIDVVNEND